ncbi:MAG TPA: ATP-binding protein [Clostridiales bacterium]|nr:ATP-binding protein [Clostridiales bacterium]
MLKEIKREWFLILGFVLTVIFMNLPAVYTYYYHDISGAPKAINARMDLSAANPADGKIYLDGEWEFYWKRFIASEPDQLYIPDLIIKVPDSWSKYRIERGSLSAEGFGSYKLTMTGLEYDNAVTLFIPDFGGAYRAFIDGQLAAESGIVSKDTKKIFTTPKADLHPLVLSNRMVHEIVIEVANARFSGLYMTPVLWDYNQIIRENSFRNAVRFILFGIVLFSLLSLLIMYIVTIRRKLHSIWLPVMVIFILMRVMLTSEFYSLWQPVLFLNLSYESTNELMYFTTFVLKYLLIFLVQEQCGIEFNKREKMYFLIHYIFLYLIYLLVPKSIYNNYLSLLIPMLTYVLDLYIFFKIYRGRHTMKKFGMVVFWDIIIVIIGLTLDSYYINGKIYIDMSLILLILFALFALIMIFVYAMRSVDLYDDFTISSSRLKLANNQIAMQKEYYDTLSRQMNEIREMKHDIRHFIRAMSRLADENKFDELRVFLGEYNEKTDREQLPIFCENTIANSIIGYYYLRAKESGIFFESFCSINRQSVMSDSDLCIVLGNALENSVYACEQMENHEKMYITIKAGTMKKQMLIKLTNSYSGNVEARDGHLISTKSGKSHGLGIRNIERVVASYGGIVKIEYNEKEFILSVAVPEK